MITKNKIIMTCLFVGMLISPGVSHAATENPASCDHCLVVADARDVVHDETTGTVLRSTSGACVRTRWVNGYDVCSGEAVARPTRAELSREERTVYFAFNQANLSPESKQRLDTLAAKLKSEQDVKQAHIVGSADRMGDSVYNEKLSKRRAENVRKYLVSKGIVNTSVAETRWVGSADSVTHCPKDLKRPQLIECLQGDRRVEVEIDYLPEQDNQ